MRVQALIETAIANGYEVRISSEEIASGTWIHVSAWKGGKKRVEYAFPTLAEASDMSLSDIHSRVEED